MFIAALFTIAKLWKQPRCPSTDEWIKKMWYLYTMGRTINFEQELWNGISSIKACYKMNIEEETFLDMCKTIKLLQKRNLSRQTFKR
jgi:hypothetical protein